MLKPGIQTHIYEVWSNEQEPIRGRVIAEFTFAQCKRQYAYHYSFEGREHTYHIVSHEAFSRETCLSFAKAMHEGKVHRLSIDLTRLDHETHK